MSFEQDVRNALARVCAKVSPDWEPPTADADPFAWARTSLDEITGLGVDQRAEAIEHVAECVRCCARGREADAARSLSAAEVLVRQTEEPAPAAKAPDAAIKIPTVEEADAAWGGVAPEPVQAIKNVPKSRGGPRRRVGRPQQPEKRVHIALFVTPRELERIDRLVTWAGCESRAAWLLEAVQREVSAAEARRLAGQRR